MGVTNKFLVRVFAAVFVAMPVSAFASSGDIGDFMNRMAVYTKDGINLVMWFFILLGLIIFGMGVWFFYKESQAANQGHMKKGFVGVGVGAVLLTLSVMINVATTSVSGGEQQSGTQYVTPNFNN